MDEIKLSSCTISDEIDIRRVSERPLALRNDRYDEDFDWKTLFYDTYQCGRFTVFQGPPLNNLYSYLKEYSLFQNVSGFLMAKHKINQRHKACDIWIRGRVKNDNISGPLGGFRLNIQPSGNHIFANKRVMLTLSKENNLEWIADWAEFYQKVHGVEAILFYDNGSTSYTAEEIRRAILRKCPSLTVVVVVWPFKYGPQGGVSGGKDGNVAPWDSDFCQTGVLQHARFRFLQNAKSVLNCDIDELVVGEKSEQSIFEYTEKRLLGLSYFKGLWIGNATEKHMESGIRRHRDFNYFSSLENNSCPNKWCIVPKITNRHYHTWSVHGIKGMKPFFGKTDYFKYRHFKAISNGWKYDRLDESNRVKPSEKLLDRKLKNAFSSADI